MQKPLDIGAVDGGNRHPAEQRLYMSLDSPAIGGKRARLFRVAAPRQQTACLGIGEIEIAEFGNHLSLARRAFLGGRIGAHRQHLREWPWPSRAPFQASTARHG